MYDEVKFAQISSESLKPSASLFRHKKNEKNLETREYLDNLPSYFDSARQCKTITLNDLSNALHRITAKARITSSLQVKESFIIGEPIAAFWYVGGKFVWYLGVVDGLDPESNQILISYLKQTDKEGSNEFFQKILTSIQRLRNKD